VCTHCTSAIQPKSISKEDFGADWSSGHAPHDASAAFAYKGVSACMVPLAPMPQACVWYMITHKNHYEHGGDDSR